MRVIGFSRRMLDRPEDITTLTNVIMPIFGASDFWFSVEGDSADRSSWEEFELEKGASKLKEEGIVGFFKEHMVAAGMNYQQYRNPSLIYPHSTVDIETMEHGNLALEQWYSLSKQLVQKLELELAIVVGDRESIEGYGTPLSIGIGLPRVFWIMYFGKGYSEIISRHKGATHFFRREESTPDGFQGFVSAPTYDSYVSASPEVLDLQRKEIGEDLFHSYPAQKNARGGAEPTWILSPTNVLRFAAFILRQHATNWRKYQAKVVPSYYRE